MVSRLWPSARALATAVLLALAGGCLNGGDGGTDGGGGNGGGNGGGGGGGGGFNQPPVANAGPAQTVAPGATVVLSGTASTDPNGDPLTFQWTQTSGATVTLTNADTAIASFTAPALVGTLTFQLQVSDGHGGTDMATVDVTVGEQARRILYVANSGGNSVLAFDVTDPAVASGDIAPDATLVGAQTLLSQPSDVVLDAAGGLLVSNFLSNAVTAYASALDPPAIDGNIAPVRNLQGTSTGLTGPVALALNPETNLLFVAGATGGMVRIYGPATTIDGDVAAVRSFTSGSLNTPRGMNFGGRDELYVANLAAGTVAVFANASNLNGAVAATRVIQSTSFSNVFDVFVDSEDIMYVVNQAPINKVSIFENASTRLGTVNPEFTLLVSGATDITAIAVDSEGRGYIVDTGANAIYGYDNIATRNGPFVPDRTIKGTNTQLNGPVRLWLHE
jgi:hypothetical protein